MLELCDSCAVTSFAGRLIAGRDIRNQGRTEQPASTRVRHIPHESDDDSDEAVMEWRQQCTKHRAAAYCSDEEQGGTVVNDAEIDIKSRS